MSKSVSQWILSALVFFIISVMCLSSLINKKTLKIEEPPSSTAINVQPNADKINVNVLNADKLKEELCITANQAKNIIEYRKEHGDFISVSEVLNVRGIGNKTYEKIKDRICV